MRSPAGSGSVGEDSSASTWKMTVPTQIANAMARPPTMVRPGYFTSIRPPSLRSSENPSNQARPRPSRSCLLVLLHAAEGDQGAPAGLDGIQPLLAHQALGLHVDMEADLLRHARLRGAAAEQQAQARAGSFEPTH